MRNFFKKNLGISTLEILLALAIMTMTVAAVVIVVFGNQSTYADSQTHQEALYKAAQALEDSRALSRKHFDSVVSTAPVLDNIYTKQMYVSELSPCFKRLQSLVFWKREARDQHVELTTYLGDPTVVFALGGDCSDQESARSWSNPSGPLTLDFNPPGSTGSHLDFIAMGNSKYVFVTSKSSVAADPDLWAINVTNPSNPSFAMPGLNISTAGINAIDVARHNATGRYYAYLANNRNVTPYQQLLVVDVTDPSAPFEVTGARRTLPGVGNSFPQGWSIFYFDEHLYIGTRETSGNELHIYDVSDPTNPTPLASLQINHSVNDILVRRESVSGSPRTVIYIASTVSTVDPPELLVFEVNYSLSIPVITSLGSFNAPDVLSGTALYAAGNRLYLGRERGSGSQQDLIVLDITDPGNPQHIGGRNLGLSPGSEVTGIEVSDGLAFISSSGITEPFQVYDVTNPANIVKRSGLNLPERSQGIEYSDHKVYLVNEGNRFIRIINDQ